MIPEYKYIENCLEYSFKILRIKWKGLYLGLTKSYKDLAINITSKYNVLSCKCGECGDISVLDDMQMNNYEVLVFYTSNLEPMCATYLNNNKQHIFLWDPIKKKKISITIHKFEKMWKIESKKEPFMNSTKLFLGIKK